MDNPITTQLDIPLIPYTDVNHAAAAYGKVWYAKYKIMAWSVWVTIVLLLVSYVLLAGFDEAFVWLAIGGLGGYPLVLIAIMHSNGQVYFLKSIAQQWGWQYVPESTLQDWHSSLMRVGHSHGLGGVLKGTMQNHPALIGTFSYTIGQGKSSTTYTRTVAKIDTNIALPHILCAVTTDIFDNHILSKTNLVQVPLEQLLENRRSLYVERKLEIEALQLFTPTAVGALELSWPEYSFELIEKELYVYGPRALTNRIDLQELFGLIQHITSKFVPQLARMQGSVKAMKEVMKKYTA